MVICLMSYIVVQLRIIDGRFGFGSAKGFRYSGTPLKFFSTPPSLASRPRSPALGSTGQMAFVCVVLIDIICHLLAGPNKCSWQGLVAPRAGKPVVVRWSLGELDTPTYAIDQSVGQHELRPACLNG